MVIRVLAIHNTDQRNRDILAKLKKRYTFLAKNSDNSLRYSVTVIKLGATRKGLRKKFDKVWYHRATVKPTDLVEYVAAIKAIMPTINIGITSCFNNDKLLNHLSMIYLYLG